MSEPWFSDPNTFGAWFGAIVGGGGGTLGGILGAVGGVCAPRGKCKDFVLGGMYLMAVGGVSLAVTGVVALLKEQPYAIWYPFLLSGCIFATVSIALIPVLRGRYREAEQRRLAAEELRRS